MKKFESFCPVRNVLSQVGDKWSVLAMVSMQKYGVCRFRDFQKDMPDISRKMLSQTLKDLEQYNLVIRKVYPEVPPRVEYSLTKLGESFLLPMNNVINWILDNKDNLFRSPHHSI
ncbi:MAG: helix-turn-helix transcriptional regulator [Bacteroidales bacterium]|jgi:DNA-binding HxlR family transcriptional regulator|nr:helix-turn-helix transcriptional regulator [Bacteroidales bacterium]